MWERQINILVTEMPRLKNCWACDISSRCRTFKGGGGTTSAEGASFLGRSGGMLPYKFLKMRVSKMAISSFLRKILYSFNTTYNFLLVNFVFEKKKRKNHKSGWGDKGLQPPPPLDQPLGSGKMLLWKILKIQLPGTAISSVFSGQIWHQMPRARAVQAVASFHI